LSEVLDLVILYHSSKCGPTLYIIVVNVDPYVYTLYIIVVNVDPYVYTLYIIVVNVDPKALTFEAF
jgi:hypothetical protein